MTRLVRLHGAEYRLTAGVIDDAARHVFTTGYCAELALALHWATGWPIVSTASGAHCGVLTPAGLVVDIEGVHDLDEPVSEVVLARLVVEPRMTEFAETFVEPLLALVAMTVETCIHCGGQHADPDDADDCAERSLRLA